MSYEPRLSHAVMTAFVSISFMFMYGKYDSKAFLFGAIVYILMCGAILLTLIEGAHYFAVTHYIEALVKMDDDLRNQLAFSVPSLRLVAKRGQVQTLFADTRATREHIHLFLQDSTNATTASRRNWNTAERPRWAWDEIYMYLRDKNMVAEFAVGNESYSWTGTAYQNLCVYFLSSSIPNLNDNHSPNAFTAPPADIQGY
jgi:hypothetical protein